MASGPCGERGYNRRPKLGFPTAGFLHFSSLHILPFVGVYLLAGLPIETIGITREVRDFTVGAVGTVGSLEKIMLFRVSRFFLAVWPAVGAVGYCRGVPFCFQ